MTSGQDYLSILAPYLIIAPVTPSSSTSYQAALAAVHTRVTGPGWSLCMEISSVRTDDTGFRNNEIQV